MNKPHAQTVLKWLKENGIKLGALTSHDTAALLASVQIAELWIRGDYGNRKRSEVAFKAIVEQMQPQTQFMAFHAIAHPSDWCYRWELWRNAGLSQDVLKNVPECAFGPRKEPPTPLGSGSLGEEAA
jgi:hypothetical protein